MGRTLRPSCPIATPRLLLRPFTSNDFEDLYAYDSRPDVARYLYWQARERGEVRQNLLRKLTQSVLEEERARLTLAVELREGGRMIGEVTLKWLSQEHQQGEIGFIFNPDYQGRGLATEAAEVMLRLAFDDLGLHRLIGRCDARNHTSARLMERLGMRQEAHFVHNELVYAILAVEWRSHWGC